MRKALFTLALLLIPALAAAQPANFEITPLAGYRLGGEFDASNEDFFEDDDLEAEIEENGIYGVIFAIPLTPGWKLELLANRQESTFIIDEGLLSPTIELGDVTVSMYHAGFAFDWGLGQVRPFIVGTLGLARIEPDFPELNAENRFSASLGGGAKIFFSPNVGLRLEGRGYWTDLGTDWEDRYDRYDSDAGGLFQAEASAGLIFAF
ncbi:MAG TPA: outer membrane beta-barrel protein [Thermoanaerobaculia bacterium]|nr:outer membrane beta-barrel protein [Thermoanaerobaculia bacterium]